MEGFTPGRTNVCVKDAIDGSRTMWALAGSLLIGAALWSGTLAMLFA